ncbi:MAG: H4MPT-linked C1 transfer pathway protein, partial [Planctomycetes bacterium]|nr:H4MPT-linked C1 transfer pathway protein [Planctomycetota bacterium]
MDHLALDVGGANIKMADGRGTSRSVIFALWRQPERLVEMLAELLCDVPRATRLSLTMTGELADCFETKREGVRAIVAAASEAAGQRNIRVFTTDGVFVRPDEAMENPLPAAAANWLALATWAGRYAAAGPALLLDVGSTTCDVVPLVDGLPTATGLRDTDRLLAGELVYTGVRRSPVCAVATTLPYRGRECPVAQEFFATTGDAHVMLGDLAESDDAVHTADDRPATRSAARHRLA